jgi:hypothetical protein
MGEMPWADVLVRTSQIAQHRHREKSHRECSSATSLPECFIDSTMREHVCRGVTTSFEFDSVQVTTLRRSDRRDLWPGTRRMSTAVAWW